MGGFKPTFAWAAIVVAALLSAGFTVAGGVSHSALAVTFAGLVVATLILPAVVVASDGWWQAMAAVAASVVAIACVWLWLSITWQQWCQCVLILASYAFAVSALGLAFRRAGIDAVVSAAIVVVLAFGWLSWPIWLSPWLAGRQTLVNMLVVAHPLLSLNAVLIDQGIWTERPQMYGWTALNQDVSYSLPAGIFWCVVVHVAVGGVWGVVFGVCRRCQPPLIVFEEEHESTRIDTNRHESASE